MKDRNVNVSYDSGFPKLFISNRVPRLIENLVCPLLKTVMKCAANQKDFYVEFRFRLQTALHKRTWNLIPQNGNSSTMAWPSEEIEGWLHQQAMYQSVGSACWRLWATNSTHRACSISMGPSGTHPLSLISRTASAQFHGSHKADCVRHWLSRSGTGWQMMGQCPENVTLWTQLTTEGLQEEIGKTELGWE